jgi:hypothetical protein
VNGITSRGDGDHLAGDDEHGKLPSHYLKSVAMVELCSDANETCGLPVTCIKEREILNRGVAEIGLPLEEIQGRMLELGRPIGPPWRQDEKLASLAAWLILTAG